MAPPPQELMEELTEDILLRVPPENPASLVRAGLVCKLWRRLVYGAAFRRRFLELNRSAIPLLCVLYTEDDSYRWDKLRILQTPMTYFAATTSFRPARSAADHDQSRLSWHAIDARHDRVLFCRSDPSNHGKDSFSVWDLVTDEQRHLPALPVFYFYLSGYSAGKWNAAVACAAAASGGACGNCCHLNCNGRHFLVVVMVMGSMYLYIYSSEAVAWSTVTVCYGTCLEQGISIFKPVPGVLVRSVFYFLLHFNDEILGYDMATHQLSTVHLPYRFRRLKRSIVLMTDDDGGLGFVANVKDKLELWSRVSDAHANFVLTRVIDLQKVLPSGAFISYSTQVNGFADGGVRRVLFIRMIDGQYTIEINSGQVRKLDNCCGDKDVVPYISFCTPTSRVQH